MPLKTSFAVALIILAMGVTGVGAVETTQIYSGTGSVGSTTVSPDGKMVAVSTQGTGINPRKVELVDTATGEVIKTLPLPPGSDIAILDLTFSPDGSQLYGTDRKEDHILVYDVATGKLTGKYGGSGKTLGYDLAMHPTQELRIGVTSPGGGSTPTMAVESSSGVVTVYDEYGKPLGSPQRVSSYPTGSPVHDIDIAADGTVATSQIAGNRKFPRQEVCFMTWNGRTWQCRETILPSLAGADLDLAPDGSQLAVGTVHKGVVILDKQQTGKPKPKPQSLDKADVNATCVDYFPDGSRIAAGYLDGTVKIWDPKTGECVETLRHGFTKNRLGDGGVMDIDVAPDGATIYTSGVDGKVKQHVLEKAKEPATSPLSRLDEVDTDADGLTDAQEEEFGTNPQDLDTDWDGKSDYDELYVYDTNPLVWDEPYTENVSEVTDPDSDDDGYSDSEEMNHMTDPYDPMSYPV